jgi:hypothetical protein
MFSVRVPLQQNCVDTLKNNPNKIFVAEWRYNIFGSRHKILSREKQTDNIPLRILTVSSIFFIIIILATRPGFARMKFWYFSIPLLYYINV